MKPCALVIIGTIQYAAMCRGSLNVVKNVLNLFCDIKLQKKRSCVCLQQDFVLSYSIENSLKAAQAPINT
jgi:hypothetical protein